MIGVAASLLAVATPAIVAQAGPHPLVGGPVVRRTFAYGADARQTIDLFTRDAAGRAPLLVYLHGGGWSAGTPRAGSGGAQPAHWTARGYAYATVGYRLVPNVTVEDQLRDVARAVTLLRGQAKVDPERVVLIGHSSGGHLAALLGAGPVWLGRHFGALRGVVLLDPAALDIAPFMAAGGSVVDRYHRPAFGTEPARWSDLSPVKHMAAPNAPAWAILYDVNNVVSGMQGTDLAAGLIAAGAKAEVTSIADTTHLRLNDEIGRPGDRATTVVDAFLAELFPDRQRARFR